MKTLTLKVSDEVYSSLELMAASTNSTVTEFVEKHIADLTNEPVTKAIEKAMAFNPGTIFNAREIMPDDLVQDQFHNYVNNIHKALQTNTNFSKVVKNPTAMVTYRRK